MDLTLFEAVMRRAGRLTPRRQVIRLLGAGAALGGAALLTDGAPDVAAKKRRAQGEHNVRGKKAIMCIDGETRRVPKKQRKKHLKRGATRGACDTTCTPVCAPGTCGSDGCGGTCACTAGTVCANGVCQACNVTCASSQTPIECGEALNTAIAGGGNVYVCPGFYDHEYDFDLTADVAIYGAGEGADSASSTILRPAGQTRVMRIRTGQLVAMANLRMTGGVSSSSGGGMRIDAGVERVTLDHCTVADNLVDNEGSGGGIRVYGGVTLEIRDCTFSGNTTESSGGAISADGLVTITSSVFTQNQAGSKGGAIRVYDASTMQIQGCTISSNSTTDGGGGIGSDGTVTISDTVITQNTAGGNGGGLYTEDGTVSLDPSVSVTQNTATGTGGGFYVNGGAVNANGAAITNNSPDNCAGITPVVC